MYKYNESKLWLNIAISGVALLFFGTVLVWRYDLMIDERSSKSTTSDVVVAFTSGSEESSPPLIQPTPAEITKKNLVCYYTMPQRNKIDEELQPAKIKPDLCSHLIIGFANIINCSIALGSSDVETFNNAVYLKSQNPQLKVLVSVGGAGGALDGFPEMVKNHANRKIGYEFVGYQGKDNFFAIFIRSVLKLTRKLHLDGLDLDWEFPAWGEANKREKIHFIQLLYELRKAFTKSNRGLILSVAVAAPETLVDECYMVPEMAEHVDFVNLMSYDYHFYSWYQPFTGHNSPLLQRKTETGYMSTLNVNYSANYWVEKGMPKEKIMIGIPVYGHSFKLINSDNHHILAPCDGYGSLGDDGFISYTKACQFLQSGATRVFDDGSKVPYAYQDLEWISYDDLFSIIYKIEWLKTSGFGGAMVFSLNTDDWNATCDRNLTFPLIRAIKTGLTA